MNNIENLINIVEIIKQKYEKFSFPPKYLIRSINLLSFHDDKTIFIKFGMS